MRMFKHFALVALLAMFLTGIGGALGTSEAKAMTLGDLVGTYRITEASGGHWVPRMRGGVVRLEQRDGDYDIVVVKPGNGALYEANQVMVTDMYVMDGRINCTCYYSSVAADPTDSVLNVYDNGQMLKVCDKSSSDWYLTLRRI